ncbi:Sacsin [Gigaspora margarita]|nr:Sacsin [Gigaspora margarita]
MSQVDIQGEIFKPGESYTNRLSKILDEYPDGSQILREIIQNSDDAKSRCQTFILDRNTYPTESLLKPRLDGYNATNLKLDRYQGPALLSMNDTIFEERDFKSLLKLADSEKHDQFDKIGAMGLGFNSVYHVTDLPSFITGDNYVILDPHERYFDGGIKFEFVKNKMAINYPDQFSPFTPYHVPHDQNFQGTIFRYPLRTAQDAIESKISDKEYNPNQILEMFHKFYENESINCLLFLKHIECIKFYELCENESELKLLYKIELANADKVRVKRELIDQNIGPIMNSLSSRKHTNITSLDAAYVATFHQQLGNEKDKVSQWIIFNWLGDLNDVEEKFNSSSRRNYKFIPNVGIAFQFDDYAAIGRLFCFLPLPITMPFRASIHGHFAVSANRRSLWTTSDNGELADNASANLKASWNQYLFNVTLPQAWVKFLTTLPSEIPFIKSQEYYDFWPIINLKSGVSINLCKDLLLNLVEKINKDDEIFQGPSKLYELGSIFGVAEICKKVQVTNNFNFRLLSISNGYFPDDTARPEISNIIERIGFPVIFIKPEVIEALKQSRHKSSIKFFSPRIVREYLHRNRSRWKDQLSRQDILLLFTYILKDKKYADFDGLEMIPLADGTFGTISRATKRIAYIGPDKKQNSERNDDKMIFANCLNQLIDKDIPNDLWIHLYEGAKSGWCLNIKIMTPSTMSEMIIKSLDGYSVTEDEIESKNPIEWIYRIWSNLYESRCDLDELRSFHLLPTNRGTIRKLQTAQKCFFNGVDDADIRVQPIFEKFGATFVNKDFEKRDFSGWLKISEFVIKLRNVTAVLKSFLANENFPKNVQQNLNPQETADLINYLCHRSSGIDHLPDLIDVIKHFPIFTEVGKENEFISLKPETRSWYLLPLEDETDYGHIIAPNTIGFLTVTNSNLRFLFETILKIPRLKQKDYWRKFVIPYLSSQPPEIFKMMLTKLFERLPQLISRDAKLKNDLNNMEFIPAGTILMSKNNQLMIDNYSLKKPCDLYDPENKDISELFFEDESVFPSGSSFSYRYLPWLKELGIKSHLSPNDIVQRITIFAKRREDDNLMDLTHQKSMKLVQYIDENYEELILSGDSGSISQEASQLAFALMNKDWIPAVDHLGNKLFLNPSSCRSEKNKNLVGLVLPIIEYSPKCDLFLRNLLWDTCPSVDIVLRQLESCVQLHEQQLSSTSQIQHDISKICDAIYEYVTKLIVFNDYESVSKFKNGLKEGSGKWILCNGKFYSSANVVFEFEKGFTSGALEIVQLPCEYRSKYREMFEKMGVRQKIGISDFINMAKEYQLWDTTMTLTIDEIRNIVMLIDHISQRIVKPTGFDYNQIMNSLKDDYGLEKLLIPSTDCQLVELSEILYDDMLNNRLDEERKNDFKIAHSLISFGVAKSLGMRMLSEKLLDESDDFNDDLEDYEQSEPLTARIRNIINDYPLNSLFKEFLQNADDAGARKFYLIADERSFNTPNSNSSLLTPEMNLWQGPALYIYNDSEFTEKDFKSLRNLGRSEKSKDNTKIGRFGIGLNCCYHLSDVISFVSGEYITFLDPSQKWLPKTGNPPRKPRGIRIKFIEKDFMKRYSDQAKPYMDIEGCDFSKRFNGTLFRIPLRTKQFMTQSEISDKASSITELANMFSRIQGSHEMLFLRNIESCGLHFIYQDQSRKLLWESKIDNITDLLREQRLLLSYETQLFQLEIETVNKLRGLMMNSEIWLICSGGSEIVGSFDLKSFSLKYKLLPRGGVASQLAQSNEPLDMLRTKPFPNPPKLWGRVYSYLSLPILTGLNVHLNGTFALSSDRKSILQYDREFVPLETPENKWNEYILFHVLPPLHAKLLEHIALLDHQRFLQTPKKNFEPITSKALWPIGRETNHTFQDYGQKLMQHLERGDHKIFWTLANGGMFTSHKDAYFAVLNISNIANVLTTLNIPIVKLDQNQFDDIKNLLPMSKFITVQLICNAFYERPDVWDSFEQPYDLVINLLKFIFQRKGETVINFRGLTLVPLLDGTIGTFGHQNYYIASSPQMKNLFKNVERSKFVGELPSELDEEFKDEEFCCNNKIKFLDVDATAILELLEYELPRDQEISWDPSGDSHPNQRWINQIFMIFTHESAKYDFKEFSRFPLLPMVLPEKKLALYNPDDPLLYLSPEAPEYGSMVPILAKLGVRFTDQAPPQNNGLVQNIATIRECILTATPMNMVESLKKAILKSSKTLEQVFLGLDSEEIEMFRKFVKNASKINLANDVMLYLGTLPIWPTYSQKDNYNFISAKSGILLPMGIPFFSFHQTANIFSAKSDEDYNMFVSLGTKQIETFEYIKEHLSPNFKSIKPDKQFVDFLVKILSLKDPKIESYLKSIPIIPNQSLTKLYRADELYSEDKDLFRTIFKGSDKFLPLDLQGDSDCLQSLEKMGLNIHINPQTFMSCARKIHSDLKQPDIQFSSMRSNAIILITYLYDNLADLNFTPQQWNELISTKFVPAEVGLKGPYNEHALKTTGFESLKSLCCQEYKHICWTKCPLFDGPVDPPKNFLEAHPKLGKPSFFQLIDNWRYVALKIFQSNDAASSWRSNDALAILKEIYTYLNDMIKLDDIENKENINTLKYVANGSKLFLNSNDPFDPESWLAGQNLVFGIKENILPGLFKVHSFLEGYKELLKIAGAKELKTVESNVNVRKHSQKDELIKELINSFEMQNETKHHDVVFCISSENKIEKVYANRYALSASSNYFRAIFCGQMIESTEFQRVTVEINDIQPDTIRVLIRWLYGQSFDDATLNMFETSEDQPSDFEARCLSFLIDLLKASDIYQVDPLKDIIEEKIITKSYINVNNVVEILEWARECSAPQLVDYCERYIELNRDLIIQKRKDNINNAENEEDRQLEKEMLNCLYQKY